MSRPLTALAALLLLLLPVTLVLGGVSMGSRLSPSSYHRAKRDDALAQRLVALGEDAARGVAYCSSGRLPPSVPSLPSLGGCCPGRNDACWLPFRDSRCYCDLFCNRTVSDCCPDFWRSCLGVPPPYPTPDLGCMRGGQKFPPGSRYRDNCNLCVCEQDAWSCERNPCLVRPELIARVNHGPYGWTASNYTSFWGMSLEDGMSTRLGTAQPDPAVLAMTSVHVPMRDGDFLPDEFDSRVRWPGLIHAPEDQGNCAASWAFSTAAVASDRLSIQTLGRVRHGLSPQQLLSCDPQGLHPGWRPAQGAAGGCRDGRLDRAWWYLRHAGVVTDECYPLGGGDQQLQCMMGSRRSGRGRREATRPCPNPSANDNRIFQCGPPYRIATDEMAIMKEIMMNGPVQALMEIHEDLFVYSRGVYSHTDAAALDPPHYRRHGMHSVRIVGWGMERTPHGNDTKYWICANSWGPWWGEEGFVRVARGRNECGVEGLVTGVWARVTPDMMATAPHAHHHHHHHQQQQAGAISSNNSRRITNMSTTSSNNISMTINMATNNNTTSQATGMATSMAPSSTNNRVGNSAATTNAIGRCVNTNTTAINTAAINSSRITTGMATTTNKNNNSRIVITNKAVTTKATGMCGHHQQRSHHQQHGHQCGYHQQRGHE